MIEVIISKHAIKRYRERTFDYSSPKNAIINRLEEVAIKGREVRIRPSGLEKCTELYFQGIFVVIMEESNKVTVITCLGGSSYRKWVKNQTAYTKVRGRTLFPQKSIT
ncbi:MAG: hypothetical protein ABFD18_11295 [Syntrophomonas sp.]